MVDWSPGRGSEQLGRRPALILQCDPINLQTRYINTIVLALTSKFHDVPTHVDLSPSETNGLAMAEVLAADHHGSLPLIFDDAFAYADPDRVQTLQRMLDLAANRGLQVIVLTCTPSDYTALGACHITLPPSTRDQLSLITPLSGGGGGRSGNTSLRETLGVDEATNDSAKHDLLDRGEIMSGKGRGGNVSLAEKSRSHFQ